MRIDMYSNLVAGFDTLELSLDQKISWYNLILRKLKYMGVNVENVNYICNYGKCSLYEFGCKLLPGYANELYWQPFHQKIVISN